MIGVFQIFTSFLCSLYFYFISANRLMLDEPMPRIVKGFECSPLDHPFLVSVGMARKSHFCGGSLISEKLVLTAAHCCEEDGYYHIWTGLTRVRGVAQSAYVAKVIPHPKYSRIPLGSDLCVLKLATGIKQNEFTKYVELVNSTTWDDWISNQKCSASVAMGFGYQGVKWENGTPKDRNAPYNPIMQCVKLAVLPPHICQLGFDESMFCAIDPLSEGRDPCQGDSGGPLVCQGVQIGIISAGFGCGIEGYASIYTRVDLFQEFLTQMIEASSRASFNLTFPMLLSFVFLTIIQILR